MILLPTPSLASRTSVPSPLLSQLPHLSASQLATLPYPPDVFPGARDVKTSFGDMRLYEWGEEKGRKIMLVHGDATPAPLWKGVAEGLVERGCRIIVLDLWGRGYSCSPNATHDSRLFGLQLLFAASSSPLPWCTEGFSIVGFSLGGGIAMDFVASFPHLVRSVALLAPVGLLRNLPVQYEELKQAAREGNGEEELRQQLAGILGVGDNEEPSICKEEEAVDGAAIQRWQYLHHEGHAASFLSSLQHGPIQGQDETWREACKVLGEKQRARHGSERLVALCGRGDNVAPAEHAREDLDGLIGRGNYVFEVVEGGHGFLLDNGASKRVVEVLELEWKL